MDRLHIATGSYINLWKDGVDVYLIINEANDVDDEKILKATTYLEDVLSHKNLKEVGWNLITEKLEDIFPYGVHTVKWR